MCHGQLPHCIVSDIFTLIGKGLLCHCGLQLPRLHLGISQQLQQLKVVRVSDRVGQREDTWTVVHPDGVLLRELMAVDRFASQSVPLSGIPAMPDFAWDYTVDDGSLVVEWYTGLPYAFLPSAERPEVLRRLRVRVRVELYHDTSSSCEADGNVEENYRVIRLRHRKLIVYFRVSRMRGETGFV